MSEYKLVPVEPTNGMINAGRKYFDNTYDWTFVGIYKAMLSALPTTDTVTVDRTEYEAMKADAERWRYFRETASEEMCYALCGNSNAENDELDHAIDQARKI